MVSIKAEYPPLSDSAATTLRPIVSTYLCESACLTLTAKHRSGISNIQTISRPALTNIEPQRDLVCRRKQLHPSHYINVFAFLFLILISYLKCKLVGIADINRSGGREVRAYATATAALGFIPSGVKPMTSKLVFTASLLDAQH